MKKISKNKAYTQAQLGYMAGIIDGEGSITITDLSVKQGRSFFATSLGISSTDEVLIDWVVEVFGGWKSSYTPKQTPKNSRKKVFRWQITGENLENMLELVYPYLVVKQREADVMFRIRKTYGVTKGGSQISDEIQQIRKECAREIAKFHCRNYKK